MLIQVTYYTTAREHFTIRVNTRFIESLMDRSLNLGDGIVDKDAGILRVGKYDYHLDGLSAKKIRDWGNGISNREES